MKPLRLAAVLLLAGLAVWLVVAWSGSPGDASVDFDDDAPGPPIGRTRLGDPSLEGKQSEVPPETDVPEGTFHIVARHATGAQLLPGVRIDDVETGFVGTTDDAGTLRLKRALHEFRFEATARGFLLSRGTARDARTTTVYLTPGVVVRGIVRDRASRAAVPNAAIRVWDDDTARFISSTVHSDAAGRFELLGVRLYHPFTLLVQVENLVPASSTHQVFDEDEEVETLVGGAGRIKGTVSGWHAGRLIPVYLVRPGARVPGDEPPPDPWELPAPIGPDLLARSAWTTLRTQTDPQGEYEIRGVPPDQAWVVVARFDAREQTRSRPTTLTTRRREAVVDLQRGGRGSLVLLFLDETGEAIRGARFRLDGAFRGFPLTDLIQPGANRARLYGGLPAGPYQLTAEQPNGPRHVRRIEIKPGRRTEVTIHSMLASTLSGTVRGANGERLVRAMLTWEPRAESDPIVRVLTDRRGQFVMRGIRGRALELTVAPPMTYEARSRYLPQKAGAVASGQTGYEIRLEPTPVIEGTVFGPRPIARVDIEVISAHFRKTLSRTIGTEGRFTLQGPAEAPGLFVFRARDLAPVHIAYNTRDDADFKLTRVWLPDPKPIRLVVQSGKRVIRGARIRPVEPRLHQVWRTNAIGEAEIRGLPTEPIDLIVDAPFYAPRTARVAPTLAATRISVDLGPELGIVEGVAGPTWMRAFGLSVRFEPDTQARRAGQGQDLLVPLDKAGRFSVLLAPGRYDVKLTTKSGSRVLKHMRPVRIRAGERTQYAR